VNAFREFGVRERDRDVAAVAALYGLGRASLVQRERLDLEYRDNGWNMAKYHALRTVSRRGSRDDRMRRHELSAQLPTAAANSVKLADALQRGGLVGWRVSAGDRHTNEIEMTHRGQRSLDRIWDRHLAMVRGAVRTLTGAETEQPARLLEKRWRRLKTVQSSGIYA